MCHHGDYHYLTWYGTIAWRQDLFSLIVSGGSVHHSRQGMMGRRHEVPDEGSLHVSVQEVESSRARARGWVYNFKGL